MVFDVLRVRSRFQRYCVNEDSVLLVVVHVAVLNIVLN